MDISAEVVLGRKIRETIEEAIKSLRERVEDLEQLNKSIVRQVVRLRERLESHGSSVCE